MELSVFLKPIFEIRTISYWLDNVHKQEHIHLD